MRKKLWVLILALIILVQAFVPAVYAASENEAISSSIYLCPFDSTSEGAGKVDPNKLNHLFGKAEHNFDALLKSFGGNQSKAYTAIENAAQSYVTKNNITGVINATNQITVKVSGYNVTVRGNVVDGVLKLGTAFIKP
jgi:hypothetical protein